MRITMRPITSLCQDKWNAENGSSFWLLAWKDQLYLSRSFFCIVLFAVLMQWQGEFEAQLFVWSRLSYAPCIASGHVQQGNKPVHRLPWCALKPVRAGFCKLASLLLTQWRKLLERIKSDWEQLHKPKVFPKVDLESEAFEAKVQQSRLCRIKPTWD